MRSMAYAAAAACLMLSAQADARTPKAKDVEGACTTMMSKLATQYEIATLTTRVQGTKVDNPGLLGELVADRAYMMRKSDLDKKWLGLHDFSAKLVAAAAMTDTHPDDLRRDATPLCIKTFGG